MDKLKDRLLVAINSAVPSSKDKEKVEATGFRKVTYVNAMFTKENEIIACQYFLNLSNNEAMSTWYKHKLLDTNPVKTNENEGDNKDEPVVRTVKTNKKKQKSS